MEMLRWCIRYELPHALRRRREDLIRAVVWRLPKSIIYWAAIRLGAHATTGGYSSQVVPDLHFMDALQRWDDR